MLTHLLAMAALLSCGGEPPALIAAHRGGLESAFPENTLAAFEHAARAGAQVIELDLRTTRDGRLVVVHDYRVNRTTNGRGRVHRMSLAEIQRLDAGGGHRIPKLEDVLTMPLPGQVELLLDLKRAPRLKPGNVVALVSRHRRLHDVLFGVRSLDSHRRLSAAGAPDLRMVALVRRPAAIAGFLEAGVEGVRVWPRWVRADPQLIPRVHAAGARVWVTTRSAPPRELQGLIEAGADVLLTDDPARAAAALCDPG